MELKKYKLKPRKKFITKIEELNLPEGTDEVVHFSQIVIPLDFKKHKPHLYKIKNAIRYFVLHNNMIDKPISVIAETNEKGYRNKLVLIDEYSRYLALVNWLRLKYVPVRYIDINNM